jgi:hypothetical protein
LDWPARDANGRFFGKTNFLAEQSHSSNACNSLQGFPARNRFIHEMISLSALHTSSELCDCGSCQRRKRNCKRAEQQAKPELKDCRQ